MEQYKYNSENRTDSFKSKCNKPVDEITIRRLWDKIKATFANKKDVLEVVKELERLEAMDNVNAVQSGVSGPIVAAGSDNTVHLKYENWAETTTQDAYGNTVHAYNESQNALTAAAAAQAIKTLRQSISNLNQFKILVVTDVDQLGHPVVPEVDYNTLYLTPAEDNEDDNNWNEWLCVPKQSYSPYAKGQAYTWEKLGADKVDLRWVKRDLKGLNEAINGLNFKIKGYTKRMADMFLDRCVKPLKELQDYINSPEYVKYIFAQLPRAAMGTDGLMSANSFAILSMLAIWASNDRKIMGGGALGPDYVIELLKKEGIDTADLEKEYGSLIG